MRRRKGVQLSAGEMEVMAMLWERGPMTLAEAHQSFRHYGRPIGYPTMQTRLLRLVEKGLVRRSSARPARYQAAIDAKQVQAGHLDQLLEKTGRQNLVPLVAHLISERPLTAAELRELKRLLARAEQASKTDKKQEG